MSPRKPVSLPSSVPATATNGGEACVDMTQPLTFWIPRPPDNANARGSSRHANRVKKEYWAELNTRLYTRYHMPAPPDVPLPRARIEALYVYRDYRYWLDSDNAMRRLKPVADWLVGHGFLAGDTPAHLEWTVPRQELAVKNSPPPLCSVRIVLTPSPTTAAGGVGKLKKPQETR